MNPLLIQSNPYIASLMIMISLPRIENLSLYLFIYFEFQLTKPNWTVDNVNVFML